MLFRSYVYFTTTVHLAYLPLPSLALQVMTALPFFFPVTTPLAATVAMDLFEDVHATALLFAIVGATVALSATLPPRFTATDVLLSLTRETRTIDVIVHEAVRFVPSAVLHVITAVPFQTALTTPVAVTVATFLFDEDHTTFLLLADAGPTAYFSVYVDRSEEHTSELQSHA